MGSFAGAHMTLTRPLPAAAVPLVPGPATAMVNAHWMLRQFGLEIDE
jgi:hypothetical protein